MMSNRKRFFSVSLSAFSCIALFCIFLFWGRILYAAGDEPDFTVRAPEVVYGVHPWWSPYSLLHPLFLKLDYARNDSVISSPGSIWAKILTTQDWDWYYVIVRVATTLFIMLPLFFMLSIEGLHNRMMGWLWRTRLEEMKKRRTAVCLSLLLPGMVYYLGVLSKEQLVLVLALIAYLLQGSALFFILIPLMAIVDIGNTVVFVSLYFHVFFYRTLLKLINKKKVIYILMILEVLVALYVGFRVLNTISGIAFLSQKSNAMISKMDGSSLLVKYPVYLRPVVTFMSFVFFTPRYIKIIPAYLLVIVVIIMLVVKMIEAVSRRRNGGEIVDFLSCLVCILSFVFMFPPYANAKYYIFATPFFFQYIGRYFSKHSIFIILFIMNIIVLLVLALYRV